MVDGDSHPAFHADNKLFPSAGPSAAGFKNSLVRLSAHLYCTQDADGTTPAVPAGTLSSSGRNLTGVSTAFNSVLQQGDLIRAAGQVRAVSLITSNTAAQTTLPFDPALPAGTSLRRLDGFDYRESVEVPLVQEKRAPSVGIVLDRSTFSQDQVTAAAGSNPTATFPASFYVTVQDRTTRPAAIAWPPDTRPELYGVIVPPVRAAGVDPAATPSMHLRVVGTSASLAGTLDVAAGTPAQEDSSLHPSEAQRITWPVQVTFQGPAAFAGMASGSVKDLELVVTARDRSGNTVTTVSDPIQLRLEANPLMLDGAVSWLSTDTRVFQIERGTARFGVAPSWTDPNAFIAAVIANFRSGSGTAGGETFESLPAAQAGSALEYSTTVGSNTIYNFALAKVRLQSATGATGVRVGFRLFRWGTANVSFDPSLAYRVHTNGIPLLGRTTSGELASVPFFAAVRVPLSASMTSQSDTANVHNFPATPASGTASYFGAYLDVNQSTPRFPATFVNDGGFNTLPAADVLSIRNLLVDHHQCMVVEILYGPDPTRSGATPGNADNLAQRNLLILQTANPGDLAITRTVQHAFDIHLPAQGATRKLPDAPFHPAVGHRHDDPGDDAAGPDGTPAVRALSASTGDAERDARRAGFAKALIEAAADPGPVLPPVPSRSSLIGLADHNNGADSPLRGTFLDLDPDFVDLSKARIHTAEARAEKWRVDLNRWKPTDGVDELGFFWNDLPRDTRVDVFLPGAVVEHVFNLRSLRGAPRTVHIVDSHTLRLDVHDGVTWLPVPPFFGERLAGLVEMELPRGLKAGRRFRVDVIQARTRPRRILGGFQLLVAVEKTVDLIPQTQRLAKIFAQRLRATPKDSRWYPILERRVAHTRTLIPGLVELAAEEEPGWKPPQEVLGEDDPRGRSLDPNADPFATPEGLQIRVVLERIDILDDQDPFLKGAGEFRFAATVHTPDEGGRVAKVRFPSRGHYDICDRGGRGGIDLECLIFEGAVEEKLAIEIRGVELDTFDPDDKLPTYRRIFHGKPEDWLGAYGPTGSLIDSEDLGPWRIHYRIERL